MNCKKTHEKAKLKKNKKREKRLKKFYADSRLTAWEQKKRVEWDMFHNKDVPKEN